LNSPCVRIKAQNDFFIMYLDSEIKKSR